MTESKEPHAGEPTVADFIVQRLRSWGVERIYGYAGDGFNGILGALRRSGNRPRFVQAAHEELCALMACAHAKYTGEIGVCMATSGPGAIHLLNGLYDANLDHQPVVAIVGQQSRRALGGHFQQDVDLASMFKDVAGAYCQEMDTAAQARHLVDTAFRVALDRRTVTCVIVPHDVQQQPAETQTPREHGAIASAIGYSAPVVVPAAKDLARAADVLNAGRKVAMLVGAGALRATDEVIETAELLGAGVAKALLGKAAVPDELPFVTGAAGWLGTAASNRMLRECDTLLMVGSGFPYSEFLPRAGQARGIQIDLDARMLNLRYPMEVALVGDAAATLRLLGPLLRRNADRVWIDAVTSWKVDGERQAMEKAMHEGGGLDPRRVVAELSPRLPDNVLLAGDCGSSTVWYARHLHIRRGMQASVSGMLATMGSAVPYATAAKFAYPDRPVVAIAGDGAMQMNGLNALITVAKYWREWRDPRFVVLVLDNRDLNFVTWEQRILEGEPKFPASQELQTFPYARYAELLGFASVRMQCSDDVARGWDEALRADRPVVVEAVVDPHVPPLPPVLQPEQQEKLRRALREDPDAEAVWEALRRDGLMTEQ